jgi:hypothetical protein
MRGGNSFLSNHLYDGAPFGLEPLKHLPRCTAQEARAMAALMRKSSYKAFVLTYERQAKFSGTMRQAR